MFRALFGSITGRITSLALLVAGLGGGMVATGGLPGFVLAGFDGTSTSSAPSAVPQVALDFPAAALAREGVQQASAQAPTAAAAVVEEQVVEVVTQVVAAPATKAKLPACVGQLEGVVNGLLNGIASITSAEQAQDMLGQAVSVAQASPQCVAQSTAAGNLGLDRLFKVGEDLLAAVGQIQALPVLAPATQPGAGPLSALTPVTDLVGKGLGATLGGVNKVTGLVGDGLGLLLN